MLHYNLSHWFTTLAEHPKYLRRMKDVLGTYLCMIQIH